MFSGILKIKKVHKHAKQRPSKKARKSSALGIEGSFLRLFSLLRKSCKSSNTAWELFICSWKSFFFFFFFFTKFPVGIILVFSRSLRLSFLNPDLPVVWQTKLSVRIAQFFPFPLLCLKSLQLKRVTFCYFFLPFFFSSWLVPQNEFDEQQVKENPFFFFSVIWEEGGMVLKKSKWNF